MGKGRLFAHAALIFTVLLSGCFLSGRALAQSVPSGCFPAGTTYECASHLAGEYIFRKMNLGCGGTDKVDQAGADAAFSAIYSGCNVLPSAIGWRSGPTTVRGCGLPDTHANVTFGMEAAPQR